MSAMFVNLNNIHLNSLPSSNRNIILSLQVVPPKGWCPRKSGYEDFEFTVKSMNFQTYLIIPYNLEPIEQNVHGNKGIYELVYFIKESKSIDKFKKQALALNKLTDGKSEQEIERLVISHFFIPILVVLEDP